MVETVYGLVFSFFAIQWSAFNTYAQTVNTTSANPQAQGSATATSTPVTSSSDFILEEVVPKSVITFVGLGIFVAIGIGIAKIADRFHDQVELRDDSSDISEHTRDLLKARFALFAFTPAKLQSEADQKMRDMELARKFGRLWMARAASSRRQKRQEAQTAILTIVGETSRPVTPTPPTAAAAAAAHRDTATPITTAAAGSTSATSASPTAAAAATPITAPLTSSAAGKGANAAAATVGVQPKVTLVSYKSKEETVSESKTEEQGVNKSKLNKEFISIDIQNLDDSTETREGSTIPSTPRTTYIEFRDVSEDVTIPVRVSTDDVPRPKGAYGAEDKPTHPKVAYADDSEFGSDLSMRPSPPQQQPAATTTTAKPAAARPVPPRSRPSTGLQITSLSRENSSESLKDNAASSSPSRPKTTANRATPTAAKVYAVGSARPKTPGPVSAAVRASSRPKTPGPVSSYMGTPSRPKTPGPVSSYMGVPLRSKAPAGGPVSGSTAAGMASRPKTSGPVSTAGGSVSRPKTPGPGPGSWAKAAAPAAAEETTKKDSRPVTSRPTTARNTTSRPLTAGRAQAITQGVRGAGGATGTTKGAAASRKDQ